MFMYFEEIRIFLYFFQFRFLVNEVKRLVWGMCGVVFRGRVGWCVWGEWGVSEEWGVGRGVWGECGVCVRACGGR